MSGSNWKMERFSHDARMGVLCMQGNRKLLLTADLSSNALYYLHSADWPSHEKLSHQWADDKMNETRSPEQATLRPHELTFAETEVVDAGIMLGVWQPSANDLFPDATEIQTKINAKLEQLMASPPKQFMRVF
jgi:hypothetical protein